MSQGKTVIQGLDPEKSNFGSAKSANSSSFYSRGSQNSNERGTIVPGMETTQNRPSGNSSEPNLSQQSPKVTNPGKPIVGFLYSISRTALGEYWPLTVGRNTIGSSASSNIQLAEGTVSSEHAVIVVRQLKNSGNVIAAITDSMSTNGTMLNGETLGFSATECHNGDIITIGNNYELSLILIDCAKLGLSVSKDFISIESEKNDRDDDVSPFSPDETRIDGFSPFDNGPTPWNNGGYTPSDGTVGMDGGYTGNNHGGTVPM